MGYPIPEMADVPPNIRECYCRTCGLIAPSWFHSDFILGDGFECIWCVFPEGHEVWEKKEGGQPPKPVGPYRQ